MSDQKSSTKSTLRYALGPGLILAAAAIGVSHLVQSTRAGAEFGFTLIWAVVLANLSKYPFLEFGPRYTIATKESLIRGYQKLGKWAIWTFGGFTVITMCIVQAAVTIVTASLAAELTGIELSPLLWSAIILAICFLILSRGQYSALDGAIKIIIVVLSISTFIALIVAATSPSGIIRPEAPSVWNETGIFFLIALMGWMPILIDASAWHSLWILERIKQTKYTPSLKESLTDFNIGYIGAGIMALAFLSLGALVMFGANIDFASSGSAFANQLVSMYTSTLGDWTYWIIIICAFTAMFSTTLTVTDGYPRACAHLFNLDLDDEAKAPVYKSYKGLLFMISLLSLGVLYLAGSRFIFMVDLATTISFLTAPVFAFINYKLIYSKHFPEDQKPPVWLKYLCWFGMIFITGFALLFLYWKISFS
ncbi:MAG: Nramp family divalent metal transporter [Balneolaceae bacterium]|nr:Nramp family divalent metal transporter [Balneolaceae bacterium]MBO6545592.1 Nramp family divalent metal transporter [Balneolaceae bacterium]MBO6646988.1 Nramp family divalent metal transporter [Balneolaceae bacterium]